MGSGALYKKQIGLGSQTGPDGRALLYYEFEVGSPGGSRSPNTLRKAYLSADRYASLFDTYPLVSISPRCKSRVSLRRRYERVGGTSNDKRLRVLDLPAILETRPMKIVPVSPERRHQAGRKTMTTVTSRTVEV